MNSSSASASQPIVKVNGLTDVVGVVPHLVGFTPSESFVVVCVHGARQRFGATMRFDLPAPEHTGVAADEVVARVNHTGAESVLVLCYTEADDDADGLARIDLWKDVQAGLSEADVAVVAAVLIRRGRWYSYTCTEDCCPPSGTAIPLDGAGAAGRVAAENVLRGRVLLASRAELEDMVKAPTPDEAAAVQQCFDEADEQLLEEWAKAGFDGVRRGTVCAVVEGVGRFSTGQRQIDDHLAARIVLGMEDKATRDAVACLEFDDHDMFIDFLATLARRTPAGSAAPICSVIAWVAYEHGHGAMANVALQRAFADDPGYSLARMIADGMDGQIPPVRLRETSRAVREQLGLDGVDGPRV